MTLRISSAKRPLAQQNQLRVNVSGFEIEKLSCMNPVSACEHFSILRQLFTSITSSEVSARMMMLMGQMRSSPVWGLPMPSNDSFLK